MVIYAALERGRFLYIPKLENFGKVPGHFTIFFHVFAAKIIFKNYLTNLLMYVIIYT